eukprot:TRINITY_DN9279_c0_g1_i1.p1 TRINITY_DN9279_c0_g1~~TRINITY_DN9279_c0_g1_i1.p1  ORF type:complete len:526 (+),score=177.73 TRINITY_DN9279_c0_g1_i1:56-1633(+)
MSSWPGDQRSEEEEGCAEGWLVQREAYGYDQGSEEEQCNSDDGAEDERRSDCLDDTLVISRRELRMVMQEVGQLKKERDQALWRCRNLSSVVNRLRSVSVSDDSASVGAATRDAGTNVDMRGVDVVTGQLPEGAGKRLVDEERRIAAEQLRSLARRHACARREIRELEGRLRRSEGAVSGKAQSADAREEASPRSMDLYVARMWARCNEATAAAVKAAKQYNLADMFVLREVGKLDEKYLESCGVTEPDDRAWLQGQVLKHEWRDDCSRYSDVSDFLTKTYLGRELRQRWQMTWEPLLAYMRQVRTELSVSVSSPPAERQDRVLTMLCDTAQRKPLAPQDVIGVLAEQLSQAREGQLSEAHSGHAPRRAAGSATPQQRRPASGTGGGGSQPGSVGRYRPPGAGNSGQMPSGAERYMAQPQTQPLMPRQFMPPQQRPEWWDQHGPPFNPAPFQMQPLVMGGWHQQMQMPPGPVAGSAGGVPVQPQQQQQQPRVRPGPGRGQAAVATGLIPLPASSRPPDPMRPPGQ